MATDGVYGMMDGTYFVPRSEILEFLNSTLDINLSKIEQTATGAVACQLMDLAYPGSVKMLRVNWTANSDFQYVENYKLLQAAFDRKKIQKYVDVDRLIRAKYQDNLEFCQWLKAFFETAIPSRNSEYDPVARRELGKGGKNLPPHFKPRGAAAKGLAAKAGTVSREPRNSSSSTMPKRQSNSSDSRPPLPDNKNPRSPPTSPPVKRVNNPNSPVSSSDTALAKKNSELMSMNAELELTLDGCEKERDFYFEKLRGIEVMLQVHEESGGNSDPDDLISKIYKVLYARSEDNVVVSDDGELLGNFDNNLDNEDDTLLDESGANMDESLIMD
mmetsp:Transcript_7224/g.10348  ORF Transcript_7224/g.10348 Transcript_7224/m.10348 type:complete len:330 (+) Transcript_7224:119-1108(+)|eukprot:CAMPEP_0184854908 /NCGR_PEP_ID=MMETSP0580-20130426/282_1 /TAXON_ID=1118495 /ORGANISM="Dactyliosolen fragilissimus" /LENGTH=329 /DNA_ID=CAMNT_0027349279 /DNA_START=70 /DNA_END=1059 /DNA_ORIENTATION=+